MPYYQVLGYGRETGRRRKRTYEAADSEAAIHAAADDETIVETVTRVYPIHHFFTKIAGISFANDDGRSRQGVAARRERFDVLHLVREPRNRHDPEAIAVYTEAGVQLGYIPEHVAEELADDMDRGQRVFCYVMAVTGGDLMEGKLTLGVNVLIVVALDPDTPNEEVQAFLDSGTIDYGG